MNKLQFCPPLVGLFALILSIGCCCSREKTNLVSYITDSFEVYAPDQSSLDEAVVQVDYAHKQITKILGEAPPPIAFLLFSSNEELIKYDYTGFSKRKIHFISWLTGQGLKNLANSGGGKAGMGVSVTMQLEGKNYIDLGIILANSEDNQKDRIIVQTVNQEMNNSRFQKGDVILQVNGQSFRKLSQFDSLYSVTREAQPLIFQILRGNETLNINLQKSASEDEFVPEPENNIFYNAISHEAGHIFFMAFVDAKLGEYNVLNPAEQSAPISFYGHPHIPDWLDEAMAIFCQPNDMKAARIMGFQYNTQKMMDLAEFCNLEHPNVQKKSEDHLAGNLDTWLIYSQSIAFAEYLLENEGADFINSMVVELAAGNTFESILSKTQTVPRDFERLNQDFVRWIEAH